MPLRASSPVEREQRSKQSEGCLSAFRMTENGKVKSTLLLYSFFLCLAYIAVYALLFAVLIVPLNDLTSGASPAVTNLVGALVPALLGTAVCAVTWPLCKDRRLMPAAYLWLLALGAACFLTLQLLLMGEGTAQLLVAQFFALFVLAPVVLGCGLSWFLYGRYRKHHPAADAALRLKEGQ